MSGVLTFFPDSNAVPGALDTQTVTTGSSGTSGAGNRRHGFISGVLGSINDGSSNLYSGAAIRELAVEEQGIGAGFNTIFTVTGVVSNSGWTSITIGGINTFTRASATFSTAGGNSTWTWVTGDIFFGTVIVEFD